ncbi:tight adherence protein B [Murinocardiopsis flavida]|uniref:Tight adherence protein B n=1 Tax=Murinocardiopsis flavida TaxID=645275 RepID=A0A2P8D265_9ACTN|nr:type II secretion system F family protein [Murinocardiopsis flavida]PSK91315.1 tight adherence protein B [Murinocardiopsis flavida]
MNYPQIILLATAVTLVLVVLAVREVAAGSQQNRALASRSAMLEVERRSASPMARLDLYLKKTEIGRKIEKRIIRAGVRIKVSTFLLLMSVVSVFSVIFVWRTLAPIFGVLSIVLVGYIFLAYLKRQEERRKEEFIAQLPEVARVLSNATSAGLALPTAVDMASEELDEPAGAELRRVAQSLKVGQSFDSAMAELRDRMPSREIGVLVSTLLVASRSGGALVTSLRNISGTLEERKETHREVKTIMSESTSTAWALTFMSVGSLFLVNLINPGVIRTMTGSFGGQIVLAISCAMMLAGVVLVRRVTTIEH